MRRLCLTVLTAAVALLLMGVFALAQDHSAKSNMQSAGQESKTAAQDTGRAAEKTTDKAKDKMTGKIDINSASSEDVQKLPGVNATTADKIIAGRPYTSKGELLSRGIVSRQHRGAQGHDEVVSYR
jgi:DNA uptake protein ComE-like DNA-binding protein